MTALGGRRRFEGVTKIIKFNTRFYLGSAAGLIAVVSVLYLFHLPIWLTAALVVGSTAMLFWTLSSMLVSWYVYDHVGVMHWNWLRASLQHEPQRWANIHAGFDESTTRLRHLLPGTEGVVIDIYDPQTMTEPSIAKARRMYPATEPFQVGSAEVLLLPDADRDAIFLLFAAHELRDPDRRTHLFREVHRVLKTDGQVLVVEHLRDLPNFVAFGPGFFHFHAGRSWEKNFRDAGLHLTGERRMTPFVRCFTLHKADARV